MKPLTHAVSVHPYFQVRPGQMPAARAILREFVDRTAREEGVLYYEFTLSGDLIFCREAYVNAEAFLAHAADVAGILDRMLAVASLLRLEIHGPAAELAKLQGPVAALNPTWFTWECGVTG